MKLSVSSRPKSARGIAAGALALLGGFVTVTCTAADTTVAGHDSWVGTITSSGDVTTVVNESGSVWGGTARLIEEASIGVDAGSQEYMLGRISGLVVAGDHVVISDPQVPVVRVYDGAGNYVRDLGRQGQGPGEYTYPAELGVRPDGAVLVKDGSRVLLFSIDGEAIATWNVSRMMGFSMLEMPLVIADDGVPFAPQVVEFSSPDSGAWKMAMFPILEGGEAGEPVRVPEAGGEPELRLRGADAPIPVPFSPEPVWSLSPGGDFVFGNSAAYRFEVRCARCVAGEPASGPGTRLIVERVVEPVAVTAAEAAWHHDQTTERTRRYVEGWVWDGPDIPATKPAYIRLMPDHNGRVWVHRPGPGRHMSACDTAQADAAEGPTECWRDTQFLDVFGPEGRFLGQLEVPDGMFFVPRPFLRDETVVAVVEDDAGTIMVKRYRLVLPGDPGPSGSGVP